ncbi:cysteine dioxygenase [Pigmentiphaga sp. NML080357]|uniref:cysteine dioxygenase family protein n=1 Tax=Pigmentiphaga sp. NML080357 TaxID=2008675 RepID=UPI000B409F3A|nr:cysteine dioxygenase [Pigmentiphaga sp. NML080357]OVZ60770.1 cysteine dioxygenase [Pigmentiphaga sp. NML080357]
MTTTPALAARLAAFVRDMDAAIEASPCESGAMLACEALLRELIAHDDWLPEDCARPHPTYYQQYLLYRDPADRYSVVSFVWGPGQRTPIHDHGTWGVIGMLRGAEFSRAYAKVDGRLVAAPTEERLEPGQTALVSPTAGDIHLVRNAFDDQVSISIHVYGTDIGKQTRHVFDPGTGAAKPFVSGYANA